MKTQVPWNFLRLSSKVSLNVDTPQPCLYGALGAFLGVRNTAWDCLLLIAFIYSLVFMSGCALAPSPVLVLGL